MPNSDYPVLDGAGNTIIPAGRPFVVNRSNVLVAALAAVALPGPADTAENILASVVIPAGLIGKNGRLVVDTLWGMTNNANVKTGRVRLGGIGGTIIGSAVLTSFASCRHLAQMWNRNALNSQIFALSGSGIGTSGTANGTAAIDTSVNQTLVITGQKATAGDTLTLEAYSVAIEQLS